MGFHDQRLPGSPTSEPEQVLLMADLAPLLISAPKACGELENLSKIDTTTTAWPNVGGDHFWHSKNVGVGDLLGI